MARGASVDSAPLFSLIVLVSAVMAVVAAASAPSYNSTGFFSLKYRFAGKDKSLSALKAHDIQRQLRFLAGVDIPLGGIGRPNAVGLYYAKIGIGTPAKEYYVQVDTGTDLMWVNCIQCRECPRKSSLGIDLTLYNVKDSNSGMPVSCDDQFCSEVNSPLSGCKANLSCPYLEIYGDGSSTTGTFMRDIVQYSQVSGDLETTTANGSVIFGCGARQSGDLSSSEEALDGILGFGKANTSMISQLASSGNVKKMFAHCLDGTNGGGIFAIGHVVQPKVNTTPLVPDQLHYSVNMTAVQVDLEFLNVTRDVFEGDSRGTILDSGTTLAYLPEIIYDQIISKIVSRQPDVKVHTNRDDHTCFQYTERMRENNIYASDQSFLTRLHMVKIVRCCMNMNEQNVLTLDDQGVSESCIKSVDDVFPNVTFHFANSLTLKVYPHDYLFPFEGLWCIGWQNSGLQSSDKRNLTLLGDLVLSNKLVVYDLQNQVIGWTEYNCSSSIELQDERSGTVHLVGSHYISSGCSSQFDLTALVGLILLIALLLNLEH